MILLQSNGMLHLKPENEEETGILLKAWACYVNKLKSKPQEKISNPEYSANDIADLLRTK
jgi:hypothetical protein